MLRAVSSLAALTVLTVVFAVARAVLALHHVGLPADAGTLWMLSMQVFLACWVGLDRKGRGLGLPFEFEAYVFWVWPLFLPYYLYKSRGAKRGILLTLFVVGLAIVPGFVATVCEVIARVM